MKGETKMKIVNLTPHMNPYMEESTIKELWCDFCLETTEHEWINGRWVCVNSLKHDDICEKRHREYVLQLAYDRGLRANTFATNDELSVLGYAREWDRGFKERKTGVRL
jgi:hypothetical protein